MVRLRKLFLSLLLSLVPAMGFAATYYVDGGCTNNGNGNGPDCAASAGGTGAFNVLFSSGTNKNLIKTLAAGDDLDVRGAHAITTDHTSSANHKGGAAFDGWYFARWLAVAFDCSSGGGHCTIHTHGWTAPGTGEWTVISGTRCPHSAGCTNCDANACTGSWTRCSTCSSGVCNGVPGTCTDTWHTVDDGTAAMTGFQTGSARDMWFGQSPSGAPMFMVSAKNQLATTHTFASTRCSVSTWKPCSTNADCSPTSRHGTCTGSATEVQGWLCASGSDPDSCATTNRLFAHFGSSLPARPYIAQTGESDGDSQNTSFDFGFLSAAKNVVVQGFQILNHVKSGVFLTNGSNGTSGITLTDVNIFYTMRGLGGNGGSRGIEHDSTTGVIVQDSEVAYTADEGIHAIGKTSTATDIVVRRTWFHHQGGNNVMGVLSNGTPSAIVLGDDNSSNTRNDMTGTEISDCLITDGVSTGSPAYPFRLETASNWKFHDNIIANESNSGAMCVVLGQAQNNQATSTNSGQIYNNYFIGCPSGGIEFNAQTGGATCSNHLIYNNTFVDCGTGANYPLYTNTITGTLASNLIRNNIFYSSGSVKQINWLNTDNTNIFDFNLVTTTANPAITWLNTNRTCAALSAAGSGNINGCPDPRFNDVAANDYHIKSTSPARDVGTATGMPSGRTADIYNTIAILHGLPAYNDNQSITNSVWDVGADEFQGSNLCLGVVCTALDQCHTAGTCNPGTGLCDNPQQANGTTCSDGNACTTGDTCISGICTPSQTLICPPRTCLTGSCTPATGLCNYTNVANGTSCNDSNLCTQTDSCQSGVCVGSNPVVCSGDQCNNAGTCNPANGICSAITPKTDGTSCNDGNLCTTGDSCQSGVCSGGVAVSCSALDQCHVAGTCNAATGLCSNPNQTNGVSCSDGNACTLSDTCQSGVCIGGSVTTCSILDQCHTLGTCDTATGACSNPVKPDGTACNDGNGATIEDVCSSGICAGVAAPGGDTGFESGAFGNGGADITGGCGCTYGLASVTSTAPLDGTYSGKLMAYPTDAGCSTMCQGMNWTWSGLSVGSRYKVRGLYKWNIVDTGSSGDRRLIMCTASDCADLSNILAEERNGIVCHSPPNCATGTRKFSFVFTATAATQTSKWLFVADPGITNDYILLDDITIIAY